MRDGRSIRRGGGRKYAEVRSHDVKIVDFARERKEERGMPKLFRALRERWSDRARESGQIAE